MRDMLKVLGARELAARLLSIGGPPLARATRQALKKSIKLIEQAEKMAAPPQFPKIRAAIGSRVARASGATGRQMSAKAGAAVGKKMNRSLVQSRKRQGVGIGERNIHWYVLGTAQRETGSKRMGRHRCGIKDRRVPTGGGVHSTGRMPAHPFIHAAAQAAAPEAYRALMLEINDYVQREWRRRGGRA